MSKKVAVLFSGGLDSTYLVWKNLKEGNEVQPVYIEIQNNAAKTMLEKNRIELLFEKFAEEFNKSYDERKIHEIIYVAKVHITYSEYSLYFKQLPIWIFGMSFLQSMKVDEIQIGYVMNDDAISYLNEIKRIYMSYSGICKSMIKLKFPIIKSHKSEMVRELPKKYLNLIISCENPSIVGSEDEKIIKYRPCCECGACNRIISTNYYEIGEFPENYKERIIDIHVNELYRQGYKVYNNKGEEYYYKSFHEVYDESSSRQLEIPFAEFENDSEICQDDKFKVKSKCKF